MFGVRFGAGYSSYPSQYCTSSNTTHRPDTARLPNTAHRPNTVHRPFPQILHNIAHHGMRCYCLMSLLLQANPAPVHHVCGPGQTRRRTWMCCMRCRRFSLKLVSCVSCNPSCNHDAILLSNSKMQPGDMHSCLADLISYRRMQYIHVGVRTCCSRDMPEPILVHAVSMSLINGIRNGNSSLCSMSLPFICNVKLLLSHCC